MIEPSWAIVMAAGASGLALGWFADALWRFINAALNERDEE